MPATNNKRASRGNTALSAFVVEVGDAGSEEQNLSDLLCSLMHLCDGQGFDFDALLDRGRFQYQNETSGPAGQAKADASFGEEGW